METRLYILIILILLSSCINKSNRTSTERNLNPTVEFKNISTLNYAIDSYYLKNGSLPDSKEDLRNEFGRDTITSLFQNPLFQDIEFKYLPIYNKSKSVYPIAYYLLGTSKNLINLNETTKNSIIDQSISVCDYYNGKKGDVIFSYRNKYLITKENLSYSFDYAKSNYLRERKFYNVSFTMNSSLKILDSLNFNIVVDSTKITGTFYNLDVKKRVQEIIGVNKYITLVGLKTSNIEGGINLINVYVKSPEDTVKGKYYNEIGELTINPSLKNCY